MEWAGAKIRAMPKASETKPGTAARLHRMSEFLRSGRVRRTALADGSGVVLDVQSMDVYSLNETGMFLVEALSEGAPDADALAARLASVFEVDPATARTDVDEFLTEFARFLKA